MNQYVQPRCPYPDTTSFSAISENAMHSFWNLTPTNLQRDLIPRFLMIRFTLNKPEVMLLVQCNGADNSVVVQTMDFMYYSVTIVIEEILTLVVDQCSKVGCVLTFQFNYVKRIDIINKLCSRLIYFKRGITITIPL